MSVAEGANNVNQGAGNGQVPEGLSGSSSNFNPSGDGDVSVAGLRKEIAALGQRLTNVETYLKSSPNSSALPNLGSNSSKATVITVNETAGGTPGAPIKDTAGKVANFNPNQETGEASPSPGRLNIGPGDYIRSETTPGGDEPSNETEVLDSQPSIETESPGSDVVQEALVAARTSPSKPIGESIKSGFNCVGRSILSLGKTLLKITGIECLCNNLKTLFERLKGKKPTTVTSEA